MIRENPEIERREVTLPISGDVAVVHEADGYAIKALLRKRMSESMYDYLAALTDSIGAKEKIGRSDILDLLLPDQEFLAIEQYKLNYYKLHNGENFLFTHICPFCGSDSQQSLPLNTLEARPIPKESTGAPDPLVRVTLPRSNMVAEIGMLTGRKELEINRQEESTGAVDLNLVHFHALRSLDGKKDFSYEDVIHLLAADHAAISGARRKLTCGYNTVVAVPCPECGRKTNTNILQHPHFFAPAG